LALADLTRRGGKTDGIQEMTNDGHPESGRRVVAAAKLFTVCFASFPGGPLPAHE
jgi:hypothetical protein